MTRGNMPDELFKDEMNRYQKAMDNFAETGHTVVWNLAAKIEDIEKDLDEVAGENKTLKERVEKLEQLTNPEAGK